MGTDDWAIAREEDGVIRRPCHPEAVENSQ